MMITKKNSKRWVSLSVAAVVAAASLTACGDQGAAKGADASDDGTTIATSITQLDGYTDETSAQPWQQMLDECSEETGIEISRQSLPTKEMIPTILRQASAKEQASLIFVDNPYLQQLAAAGAITPLEDLDIDTSGYYQSIIDAGTWDGKLYGIAPGVNALALFYNVEMFEKAGIEPPTNWEELKSAAAKLTAGDTYGLAYSSINTEEGTWQFLPAFWGAGAEFDNLASPEAVEAMEYVVSFVEEGYTSPSAVNWNQAEAADQFLAGQAAMVVTGSWNLANFAAQDNVKWDVVPIPAKDGGNAPVALGGEIGFVSNVDGPEARAAAKVLECMVSPEHQLFWGDAHAYVPAIESVAAEAAKKNPDLQAFVDAVADARSRSAELGDKYPPLSAALIEALQESLQGKSTPEEALKAAQAKVEGQ